MFLKLVVVLSLLFIGIFKNKVLVFLFFVFVSKIIFGFLMKIWIEICFSLVALIVVVGLRLFLVVIVLDGCWGVSGVLFIDSLLVNVDLNTSDRINRNFRLIIIRKFCIFIIIKYRINKNFKVSLCFEFVFEDK